MRFLKFLFIITLLCPSFSQAQTNDTEFLFVNGGSSPTANFILHEFDARAFYENLFQSKGTIINADGDGSKVVGIDSEKTFVRDENGWIKLGPSTLQGTKSATLENVSESIDKIAKDKPKAVTIVFGDHGGKGNIALWNYKLLNYEKFSELESKFNDETLVRNIHLHCYSGSMLKNEAPMTSEQSLGEYLTKQYRPNVCGVAVAAPDQIGQYISWNGDYQQNKWKNYFEKNKNPTLNDIKQMLNSDTEFFSDPSLTSDHFLEDVQKYLCSVQTPKNETFYEGLLCSPKVELTLQSDVKEFAEVLIEKLSESKTQSDISELCTEKKLHQDQIKKINDYQIYSKASDEMASITNTCKDKFMLENYPIFYKEVVDAFSERDAIKLKILSQSEPTQEQKETLKKAKETLDEWDLKKASLSGIQKFDLYFESCFKDELALTYKKFPLVSSQFLNQIKTFSAIKLQNQILRSQYSYARARSQIEQELTKFRKEKLSLWLLKKENQKIRDLYENILKCENSPLN